MSEASTIRSGVEGEAPAIGQKVSDRGGALDVFNAPERHYETVYESDEVTANCPITSAPDWYTVKIVVGAESELLIESKSLKLYLHSFRDKGIFAEAFAALIADDCAKAIKAPVYCEVTQKPRGGITIHTKSWGYYTEEEPDAGNPDL